MIKPLLTILIPTYRNPQVLQTCLHTLLLNTEYPYKVVVLNNDPSPGSRDAVGKIVQSCEFAQMSAKHLESNLGWMGALNVGMADVETPFVCMLNDDVVFVPGQSDFWRRLVGHLADSSVAAVGPSSNFVMGVQSVFAYNGIPSALYSKFLIGFCMVLRTEVFRQVGLLDETLPGGDDLDLSMRLRQAGFRLLCERGAYLHHIGCTTGNRVHQGYWNSELQQDRTNNALIRKHGIKAWYELLSGDPVSLSLTPEIVAYRDEERVWVEAQTPVEGKGFSVGCGNKKVRGEFGLDMAKVGENGAGGRKFTGAAPDVTGMAEILPIGDHCLDYILALHVFEHLLDPISVLNEWGRVLKLGGKLILVCPDHHRLKTMMIDYTHLHAFVPESLEALLRVAGWTVERPVAFGVGSFGIVALKYETVTDQACVVEGLTLEEVS